MANRTLRANSTTAAYVLHRYAWSESSLILDLFTREQGRLAVAAKGAKRPYSQLRSVLLPFQPISVSLGRSKKSDSLGDETSEVQVLRGAEWVGGAAMLTGAALFSGFYLNELLMRLLARQDPHPVLFDAYVQSLSALCMTTDVTVESVLRAFEFTLLRQVGVLPDLSLVTLTLEPVLDSVQYTLLPEAGIGVLRPGDSSVSGQVLIGLQAALEHGSLTALQQACGQALPELKLLLRGLLYYHLGSSVLRTRQVMLDVQALEH